MQGNFIFYLYSPFISNELFRTLTLLDYNIKCCLAARFSQCWCSCMVCRLLKNVRVQCCTAWIRLDARRKRNEIQLTSTQTRTHISNKCDMMTFIHPNAFSWFDVYCCVRNSHEYSSTFYRSLSTSPFIYKNGWKCNFDANNKHRKGASKTGSNQLKGMSERASWRNSCSYRV